LDSSLIGDDFVDESAAIRKSKGYADHFECNGHNPLGLGIEAVQELSDGHGTPHLPAMESIYSLWM